MLGTPPHHGVIFTILALAVGLLLHYLWLLCLRRLKLGQPIRSDGPQSHLAKKGTPTMGGLATVLSLLLVVWLTIPQINVSQLIALATMLGFGGIGLLDDLLKLRRGKNLGLRAWQKMSLQWAVGLGLALALLTYMPSAEGLRGLIPISGVYFFWVLLVSSATSNAFNITDGLDGLATLCLIPLWILLGLTCVRVGLIPLAGLCFLDAVLCVTFLVFNSSPAKMFMGEVGIMAQAGLAASIALMANAEWVLALGGLVFVAETLSVIMQVSYFKVTHGKRIFKMSPLHHHFELSGWSEQKVVLSFAFAAAVCSATALVLMKQLLW